MKSQLFLFFFLLVVASTTDKINRIDWKPLTCRLCEDVVIDVDKFLGEEGRKDENKTIAECQRVFHVLGKNFDESFCIGFFKNELDDILKKLNDPEFRKEEAFKLCSSIHLC